MPDLADEAQKHEADLLASALAGMRFPVQEEQDRDESGTVICLDCGVPIPLRRLQAVPGACRCAPCQEIEDGNG